MVARGCDGDTRERSPARGRGKCHFLGRQSCGGLPGRSHRPDWWGARPRPCLPRPGRGAGWRKGTTGNDRPAPAPLSRAFASPQLLPPPGQSSQTQLASSPYEFRGAAPWGTPQQRRLGLRRSRAACAVLLGGVHVPCSRGWRVQSHQYQPALLSASGCALRPRFPRRSPHGADVRPAQAQGGTASSAGEPTARSGLVASPDQQLLA